MRFDGVQLKALDLGVSKVSPFSVSSAPPVLAYLANFVFGHAPFYIRFV